MFSLLIATASLDLVDKPNPDAIFCSVGFWQNSRAMGFRSDQGSLSEIEIEISPYGDDDDQVFSSARWNGDKDDYWALPLSLTVNVGWDDGRAPAEGSVFVLKVDGIERARKAALGIDPKSIGFEWEIWSNPPNVFGHKTIQIDTIAPDGTVTMRKQSKLPNWSYLRSRGRSARDWLKRDSAGSAHLCGPGLHI